MKIECHVAHAALESKLKRQLTLYLNMRVRFLAEPALAGPEAQECLNGYLIWGGVALRVGGYHITGIT